MSRFLVRATALVAGLAAAAGIASPGLAAAPKAPKKAIAVVVVRTGGGHGGQSVFTLVGSANRQEAQVLRLASSPAFLALRPRYAPAHTAKSRYTYRIEAGYRDDSKKRVTVVEGTPGTPKVALDVIELMTDVEPPDLSDLRGLPVSFPPGFPFN